MYIQPKITALKHFAQENKVTRFLAMLIRTLGWKKFTLALSAGIFVGVALFFFILPTRSQNTETTESNITVTLKTVGELISGHNAISLVGDVESVSEATIHTETAGIVKYVSYSLGDTVRRGAVIAEIENSRERAAVLGAHAALTQIQSAQTRNTATVYTEASNTYRQAFTRASDAVFGKTDSFFVAPRTSDPKLNISPFGKFSLEKDRGKINDILAEWERKLPEADKQDRIVALLTKAEKDTRTIKLFLDRLATIVNRQTVGGSRTQATIDAEKAGLFVARSNMDASLLAITTTLNTLSRVLPRNGGGTGESEASVEAAEASFESAQAGLEKTIIRAPLSGTLNALNIKAGDFVSAFAPVATIANNGTLEIVTYVSSDDLPRIAVGDTVQIEGGIYGVITKIAPALNPTTKKIEVRIGIDDEHTALINGSSVRVSIIPATNTLVVSEKSTMLIPLEALKLTNGRTFVFGIDEANKTLVAHPVERGRVVGDSVEIRGIDRSLKIVTDARGLSEGQRVEVLSN